MKNVFGFNAKEETMKLDGHCFIIKEIEQELEDSQDEVNEEMQVHNKKASSNLLNWVSVIFLILGCIFLSAFLRNLDIINEIPKERIILVISLGIACFLIYFICLIVLKIKRNEVVESSSFEQTVIKADENYKQATKQLDIPEDAQYIDVLCFPYKIKKDVKKPAGTFCEYVNIETRIFTKDNLLCVADIQYLLAFPLESIKNVKLFKKTISFPNWNKEEIYNKGEYKQYKIVQNGYGVYFVKYYYSVEIEKDGETYELMIPNYEKDVLSKFIKIEE